VPQANETYCKGRPEDYIGGGKIFDRLGLKAKQIPCFKVGEIRSWEGEKKRARKYCHVSGLGRLGTVDKPASTGRKRKVHVPKDQREWGKVCPAAQKGELTWVEVGPLLGQSFVRIKREETQVF